IEGVSINRPSTGKAAPGVFRIAVTVENTSVSTRPGQQLTRGDVLFAHEKRVAEAVRDGGPAGPARPPDQPGAGGTGPRSRRRIVESSPVWLYKFAAAGNHRPFGAVGPAIGAVVAHASGYRGAARVGGESRRRGVGAVDGRNSPPGRAEVERQIVL